MNDDISLKIDEKEKEIIHASANLNTVIEEQFRLKKALLETSEMVRIGKFNLTRMRAERSMLEREYWRGK